MRNLYRAVPGSLSCRPLLFLAGFVCLLSGGICAQTSPGALDSGFNPVLGNGSVSVYAVAVQADRKILVGGDFSTVNGVARANLARLNPDGSLDAGFPNVSGADSAVRSLSILADGRVAFGGDFWTINGASWRGVGLLLGNGGLDPVFGQFSGANSRVNAVCAQPDGKVLIGGAFTQVNGTSRNYIARLNADGSLDTSFTATANGIVYAMALRSDGKVLIGGDFTYLNNTPRQYLAQLTAEGQLDTGFSATPDYTVYAICIQPNGQTLVGGMFSKVNNSARDYIARLNVDGQVDSAFTAGSSGTVYSIVVQADGKVLVAGRFSSINGTKRNNIARLNANGLLDSTFDTGVGPDYTVRALALQPDGKLVLGGEFSSVASVNRTALARLECFQPVVNQDPVPFQIATAVEIGWVSETNRQYQVQWSYEASPTEWHSLGGPVAGTGGTNWLFDSTRTLARKFYRVVPLE